MNDSEPNLQERIAREQCHDAQYIGTDGEGATHYWSIYYQTAIVIEGTEPEQFPLSETPINTLAEWMQHTCNKRGSWETHRVSTGLADTLRRTLEANA